MATTGASSTDWPGQCGDGALQPPEQCDDDNFDDGDGCDAACRFEYRIAFVSSASYIGKELGGAEGGDDKCNALAGAADQLLGRTFKAWLSSADLDARDRIGASSLPYRLADHVTEVALDSSTFGAEMLLAPIDRDEKGEMATGEQQVWTGTIPGGTEALDHCDGWSLDAQMTGLTGLWSSSMSSWTAAASVDCTLPRRIYCIEYPQ